MAKHYRGEIKIPVNLASIGKTIYEIKSPGLENDFWHSSYLPMYNTGDDALRIPIKYGSSLRDTGRCFLQSNTFEQKYKGFSEFSREIFF